MRYVKPVEKKTKSKIFILTAGGRDHKCEDIYDVTDRERIETYYEFPDGRIVDNWWGLSQQERNSAVRKQRNITKEAGYQEVSPFIFSAEFFITGAGATSAYTEIVQFEEFLPHNQGGRFKFKPGITPGNFTWLFTELLHKYPTQFQMTKNGDKFIFSGTWKFELNKNKICIAPYVQDYKKDNEEDDWDA